jgi:hypothetical protein
MADELTHFVALVVPASLRAEANLLACALGYDTLPGSRFSIALAHDGASEVTHYGFASEVTSAFVDLIASVAHGDLPPIAWGDYGLTVGDVGEIIQNLYYDKRHVDEAAGFYAEFLRVNGFVEV